MKNLLIIAAALTIASNAQAYRLNKVAEAGARWKTLPVSMKLNPANSGLKDDEVNRVISNAMGSWNTGTAKDVLAISGIDASATAATGMDMDGINSITFSADFREDSNGFDPDTTVAVGGQYGDGDAMMDAFIIFNAEAVAWNTDQAKSTIKGISYSDDLETIAVHELGHVIGLGHSDITTAIMSSSRSGKTARTLTDDDISGAKYLTGSADASGTGSSSGSDGSSSAGGTAGCGSLGNNNASSSNGNMGGMAAMMLLPLTVLVFARRRAAATTQAM
jgi:hypothetical protein